MSHKRNCPDPWDVRLDASRDARNDADYRWSPSTFRGNDYSCDEATSEYRRTYDLAYDDRQKELADERRAKQRQRDAQEEYEARERAAIEEQEYTEYTEYMEAQFKALALAPEPSTPNSASAESEAATGSPQHNAVADSPPGAVVRPGPADDLQRRNT